MERIEWDAKSADHIRTRSDRYEGAIDVAPEWTAEVVVDPDRLVDEPDPNSAHANSVRIVGYSFSAQMVITVVALRDRYGGLHGASAWKTTGVALRQYLEGTA
ncbi:MAG TPA: transposase [Mycobacteriales bacterium]|nr:transposase [Mycobacteriales bacterium]